MDMQGQISPEIILNIFGELSSSENKYELSFSSNFNEQLKFNFKNGRLYFVPTESSKGLEIYLVGFNLLTVEQVEELIKYRDESGLPLESILQEADILTSDQTMEVWKSIVDDLILDLFTWEGGSYQINELSDDFDETSGIFDLTSLATYEEQIHERLSQVEKLGGYTNVPTQIADAVSAWMQENKELLTEQLFGSIDGQNNLNNILNWSYTTKGETLKLLSFFAENNLISLSQEGSVEAPEVVAQTVENAEPIENVESSPVEIPVDANEGGNQELSTDTPLPSTGNFSGSLSILSLIEVIQTLNTARRSGLLVLDIEGGPANLKMYKGELVAIEFGEIKNRDAFYKLVSIHKGEFYFEATADAYEREMNIPTMSLLMEAMRLIDESEGGDGTGIESILNEESESEPITSARALTKKSSGAAFFIKLSVILVLAGVAAYMFLIYLPAGKKKMAFDKIRLSNSRAIASNDYERAKKNWSDFQSKNPGWYDDIGKEISKIELSRSKALNKVFADIKIYVKNEKYELALKSIVDNSYLAIGNKKSQKKLEKQKIEIVKEQKVKDYFSWKKTSGENLKLAETLVKDHENIKALKLLSPIKDQIDPKTDVELNKSLIVLLKKLNEREKNIDNAKKTIFSKDATFSGKMDAYKTIVSNAGVNSSRGIEAAENLKTFQLKVKGFDLKINKILTTDKKLTIKDINKLLKELEGEASNSDELQYIQKLIEKNKEKNKAAEVLFKDYKKEFSAKRFEKAFKICKEIFLNYKTADCTKKIKTPFKIIGSSKSIVTINNKQVKLPYVGSIPNNLKYILIGKINGCENIQMTLNSDISNFEIPLIFKKEPLWSYDFNGNFKSVPKLLKVNGKQGLLLANGQDLELVLIETGGRVWRRQINNSNKPYVKSDGKKMIYGDDEFWKLESQFAVFENYISLGNKNSQLIILNGEDGNPIVNEQLGFIADSEPLFLRLPLLGNKIFVYAGTKNGELINIKISDRRVRLRKFIGSRGNGIISIKKFDNYHLLVVLESEVKCYTISNLKLKWTKRLDNKAKSAFVLKGNLFIQTKDGVVLANGTPKEWKSISFPSANIKNLSYTKDAYIVKTNQNTFYELSTNRFIELSQFANVKMICKFKDSYYVLDDQYLKCYLNNNIIWQINVKTSKSSMVLVSNMILLSINSKIFAYKLN
ncbi:MAG: hypothetical protein COA79_00390 [Planctomycetota bacterium]|nr:MAG: hypothetical protein COA79_00390 [Planctomycetota bacterium]